MYTTWLDSDNVASKITGFCGKTPAEALRRPRSGVCVPAYKEGHPETDSLSRANLAANTRGWLAYLPDETELCRWDARDNHPRWIP